MSGCLFCDIVAGKLPCDTVYEDEHILAFKDLYPKAPVHVLVIPKQHVDSLAHLQAEHADIVSHLTLKLAKIAKMCGLQAGFKVQINTGAKGGQEVFHLHYHIMGTPA